MADNEWLAQAEAVLFASGEPVSRSRLAQALEITEAEVEKVCQTLQKEYEARKSGIMLVVLEDKYQLCSRPDYFAAVKKALDLRRNTPLSQAAFEVLAIIAYNQPVTKAFIEQVRGVDCSGVVASLCEKGLVTEKGRLELPGRPLVYGTTDDFLRCFSVTSLGDLPPLPQREEPTEEENGQQRLVLPLSAGKNAE